MKKFVRVLWRALPFLVLAAVVAGTLFYPVSAETSPSPVCIVRVWNVDTFEGGKGSRTAFLQRAARLAEDGTTFYRVLSYTPEGAQAALDAGEFPDILSFGTGLHVPKERCLPLGRQFAGVSAALPWCRGEYRLFSLTDDFEGAGETVVSVGGRNLACAAAYFAEIAGAEEEALSAYLDFLGGKYRYLLGTQRDSARFAARGVNVAMRPLPAYCDLLQYVCVFSEERYEACMRFVGMLLSDSVQSALDDIGMLPAAGASGLTSDPFADAQTYSAAAQAVRAGNAEKIPQNFFKSI